jgi:hypothetical protein
MGKAKENPRYEVVSTRLNGEEKEILEVLAKDRQESIGATLRHALNELFASTLVKL